MTTPGAAVGDKAAAGENACVQPGQPSMLQDPPARGEPPAAAWWRVEGADGTTGADRLIRVQADGPAEAERQARAAGLLVSSVEADEDAGGTAASAQPLDYRSGRRDAAPALGPNPMIVRGYAALRVLAHALRGVALLCLIGAGLVIVWPFVTRQSQFMAMADWLPVAASALTPAAAGVVLVALAEALRMLGAIGLAVDEIARKS
jgi:hypothetical protein